MNSTIKLIPANTQITSLLQLRARCKTMRAFAYFNLIRIYGNGNTGIPFYSDNNSEDIPGRADTQLIVNRVKSDLLESYDLLAGYTRSNKLQINQQVVAGLLARFYLEYGTSNQDYSDAVQYAQVARSGNPLMSNNMIAFPDAGFDGQSNIDNTEWIWGTNIDGVTSTIFASFFSQIGSLSPGYAGLLFAFKSGDKRLIDNIPVTDKRRNWFNNSSTANMLPSTVPLRANLKFVDASGGSFLGDYVYMRAAEMYLIEAEAKFKAGDESGAKLVLTQLVSTRNPSYSITALTGNVLRDEIRYQRSLELWGEGFSFFDMKRWGLALQRTYTNTNHRTFGLLDFPANSTKFIFQIPEVEMLNNIDIQENNPF
jgi:hypothetical protein